MPFENLGVIDWVAIFIYSLRYSFITALVSCVIAFIALKTWRSKYSSLKIKLISLIVAVIAFQLSTTLFSIINLQQDQNSIESVRVLEQRMVSDYGASFLNRDNFSNTLAFNIMVPRNGEYRVYFVGSFLNEYRRVYSKDYPSLYLQKGDNLVEVIVEDSSISIYSNTAIEHSILIKPLNSSYKLVQKRALLEFSYGNEEYYYVEGIQLHSPNGLGDGFGCAGARQEHVVCSVSQNLKDTSVDN